LSPTRSHPAANASKKYGNRFRTSATPRHHGPKRTSEGSGSQSIRQWSNNLASTFTSCCSWLSSLGRVPHWTKSGPMHVSAAAAASHRGDQLRIVPVDRFTTNLLESRPSLTGPIRGLRSIKPGSRKSQHEAHSAFQEA
jgi:hypothetical protein